LESILASASHDAPRGPRQALRRQLLEKRAAFAGGPAFAEAEAALSRHLCAVLRQLEPQTLGVYWPHRGEFNAAGAVVADAGFAGLSLALPFSKRAPVAMHYRVWQREAPSAVDECGIPCSEGAPAEPDVVLVPCVGFTPSGHRLGYGGGYFDRWIAAHPGATTVGIAWAAAEIEDEALQPAPHDQPLTLVITEHGAVA
jgi:5-formyltetrahydrofolate cyclo-ligase